MQWHPKKVIVVVAMVMVLWLPTIQAQETETLGDSLQAYTQKLRWKNGDVLPGQLLENSSETIRWASPYFLDDLVVGTSVLDAVVFPRQSVPANEAFRVGTVSGDVWVADLIGSDDNTFLFFSERHGQFRVNRKAIISLEHREHRKFLFDGSQLTSWKTFKSKEDIDDSMFLVLQGLRANWYADREGRPRTSQDKAELFQAFKWPKRFEIDLELAFTGHSPNFVFALGKDLYQALRLEIWSDKLVAVQGTLFQPVLTIQPEQHNFRLRLTYDEGTGVLRVFDFTGNLLLRLDGVKPTIQESGLYVQNRGENLTVQRLKVYRQLAKSAKQQEDPSKPRVYMVDGEVIQGKLFVQKDSVYVLNTDGTRRNIDLQQVDRVVQPGVPLTGVNHPVALTYPDGTVLHGRVIQVSPDNVLLQTAFADAPVTCAFAGASQLHFNTNPKTGEPVQNVDKLFYSSGSLSGRVLFNENRAESPIQWKPIGALKSVRLANNTVSHIERSLQPASKASLHFDTAQFRHTLHLQSGEIFPCHITSYDGTTVNFESPFISVQRMDSTNMKALEFSNRTYPPSNDKTHTTSAKNSISFFFKDAKNGFNNGQIQKIEIWENGKKRVIKDGIKIKNLEDGEVWIIDAIDTTKFGMDPQQESKNGKLDVKLERALTVPRFNRDNPPNHILVANTDDMMRGKFLGFNGQTLQFDSKLRKFSIPIDRVARVVDVSIDSIQESAVSKEVSNQPKTTQSEVHVRLTDSSILIFEPIEVKDGKLLGRSPIYGEVSVPVDSIQYFHFGEKAKSFKSVFEKWVVRPAKEPAYGDTP